jgi:hypothetical protein
MNLTAILGCAALDFAGLVLGLYWLAYGAVGLMGGLITGMKYGYVDSMRIWAGPRTTDATTDASASVSTDSPAEPAEELGDPAS